MSIEPLTSETDLAGRLGVSLDALRLARETHLTEGTHYERDGRHVLLSRAGVERLIGVPLEPKKKEGGPALVKVVVVSTGDRGRNLRWLRGRVVSSGAVCTVYLTGRGTLAKQFRPRQELECTAHPERADAFEFDGKAPPKRMPI